MTPLAGNPDFDLCLTQDLARLKRLFRELKQKPEKTSSFWQVYQDSCQRVEARKARIPAFNYPSALPIVEKRGDILKALQDHQVVVITGETGSGKTTQIPKLCLEAGLGSRGKIGCTQPRRLAATSLAEQVAKELERPLGQEVGYKIRFQDKSNQDSLILFMTDGILLAEFERDPWLNQYECIIIDEAHERSLNIDFLLGCLKSLLVKRPELKLVITSATIDVEKFAQSYPLYRHQGRSLMQSQGQAEPQPAPIIEVSGRLYPVELRYHPLDELLEEEGELSMPDLVRDAVEELITEPAGGDVLVFMSGSAEIKETAAKLAYLEKENFWILPLYGLLTQGEQNRIFQPSRQRKVILATNIAETSLTIPGIKSVVDTGRARLSRYNSATGTQGLPVEAISQASARQRLGRCGRLSGGICIRLYTEEDFLSRPAFTPPEIQRSNLAEVLLRMKALKLGRPEDFPFLDPPDGAQLRAGLRQLKELGALCEQGSLTQIGRELSRLPLEPRIGRMVLQAKEERVLWPVLILAAAISCRDPREWPEDKKTQAQQKHKPLEHEDSELMTLLSLWEHYEGKMEELGSQSRMRKYCKANFLSFVRFREWIDIHHQLVRLAQDANWPLTKPDNWDYDAIHRSILAGCLSQIAQKKEARLYQAAKNRELLIFPASPQAKAKHEWIMAVELLETSRLFGLRIAKIDPAWIEPLAPHLCKKSWHSPRWDHKSQRVVAWERVLLFGLEVIKNRKVDYGPIQQAEAHEIFVRQVLVPGLLQSQARFWRHNQELMQSIKDQEARSRKKGLLAQDDQIAQFYFERIPGISSLPDLNALIKEKGGDGFLHMTEADLLTQESQGLEELYPKSLNLGGQELQLSYHFEPGHPQDGVTLHLPPGLVSSLDERSFEDLVPGLLKEKILWMLKNLPKEDRKKLVPIPEKAEEVWQELTQAAWTSQPDPNWSKGLAFRISDLVFKLFRVLVAPEILEALPLPDHLRMNFLVEAGGQAKQSRNLADFTQAPPPGQDHWARLVASREVCPVEAWDFEEVLQEELLSQPGELPLFGFPCLIHQDGILRLSLVKELKEARQHQHQGAAFLLAQELKTELAQCHQALRLSPTALGVLFALEQGDKRLASQGLAQKLGKGLQKREESRFHQELQEQLYRQAKAEILGFRGQALAKRKDYQTRLAWARLELTNLPQKLTSALESALPKLVGLHSQMLTLGPQVESDYLDWLSSELDLLWARPLFSPLPLAGWCELPRLLAGVQRRLERIKQQPQVEEQRLDQLVPYLEQAESLLPSLSAADPELAWAIRTWFWMLEEYKISLFAQDLGTAFPISTKRLDRFFADEVKPRLNP